jgi:ankyrin repeat protein
MKRVVSTALALVALALVSLQAQDQGAQLRRALFAGHTSQVTPLATSKAAVNSADGDGVTPLMIAAALGQSQAVKILLAAGAAIEAQTKIDKISALIFASDLGHLEEGPSGAGAGVGSASGNLLAIGGQADLKKLIDKARAAAQ